MEQEPSLFERLGGTEAVRAVVQDFYTRLLEDEQLALFFEDIKMPLLKAHQLRFFKLAFTGIPADMDVVSLLLEKHEKLFRYKGLNATHFDLVAGHFVDSMQHLNVPSELIDEAVQVVVPLRPIFEQGAEKFQGTISDDDAGKENKVENNLRGLTSSGTLYEKLGGAKALRAAVDEMYKRLVEDPETGMFFETINMAKLRQHQIGFMKIAFTEIPPDLDVPGLLKIKHAALFDKGLNEKHFDVVAKHFIGALTFLDIEQALIDEAVAVVAPLRPVFEEGAREAAARKRFI